MWPSLPLTGWAKLAQRIRDDVVRAERERTTVETCGTCGQPANPAGSYWFAPNDLWNEVHGSPNGFRCIPCFTRDCRAKGISVAWTTTEVLRDNTMRRGLWPAWWWDRG